MPGLDQEDREVLEARLHRLAFKEAEFQISQKMANYIDTLETYLLDLEDRVVSLETMLGLRGMTSHRHL